MPNALKDLAEKGRLSNPRYEAVLEAFPEAFMARDGSGIK
jgi:hypothetical protein